MKRFKLALLSATAIMAGTLGASAHGFFGIAIQPRLCLPHAVVARGRALSPHAVASRLATHRFRVQAMYRRGPAYAVKAVGPSGSDVEMMVDGQSGAIIGLNVVHAAKGTVVAFKSNTKGFVDDLHPFGAVVPALIYAGWQSYKENEWEQREADEIAVENNYAAYTAAVPYYYMHTNARTGLSYAIAPPSYRGYQLADYSGRQLQYSESRADLANARAEIELERADNSDFQRSLAEDDAASANIRADQLEQDNSDLADVADRERQRAEQAEQQNDELQQQLAAQHEADQQVAPEQADDATATEDTGGTALENAPPPDAEASSAVSADDQGGASTDGTPAADDQGSGTDQTVNTGDAGGTSDDQQVTPTDQGGEQQQSDENNGADRQQAAPADQGGEQQQAAPADQGDEQQAAPADQGGEQQQPQSDESNADQQQAAPADQGGEQQQPQSEENNGGDQQQSAPGDQGGGEMQQPQNDETQGGDSGNGSDNGNGQ